MNITEILREAIQGEKKAYELYTGAADLVQTEHIRALLRELAGEELGHKAALERMLANPEHLPRQVEQLKEAPVEDYKVTDHLVAGELGPDATFQDVCIFAARKEQQSYELYSNMAAQSEGESRDLLQAMAKDELRHKNLVEGWYEDVVYQEF